MRSAPVSKTKALLGKLVTMKATNEIIPFTSSQFGKLRTIKLDGVVWFGAKDAAVSLGYSRPLNAVKAHCCLESLKRVPLPDTRGHRQNTYIIDQANLLRLITHSKLPEAQKFEAWIFEEVIPTVLSTGSYSVEQTREITSQVDRLTQLQEKQSKENLYLLNRLQAQQQEIERLQRQQKAALPAPRLGAAEGAMSTTQALRYLKYHYPHITREWVFAKLRSSGCMCKNSCEPTVNGIRHGIVVPKIDVWVDYKGVKHVGRQYSHITSADLDWLMNCARFEAMEAVM